MFNDIAILKTATGMARHAAARQELIAENIANADTPGFKARDVEPFKEVYARGDAFTAPDEGEQQYRIDTIEHSGTASPNGNTVSLEDQMWRSAATARQHETALMIYTKSLNLLRSALGGSGR